MSKITSAIHRQMPIAEIITLIPEAKSVLAEYGLHCFSCAGSEFETLVEGCLGHGFSEEEIDELVDDLNQMLDALPPRTQIITLTADAARAIKKVAKDEGQESAGLAVIADAAGGFCMEFCDGNSAAFQAAETFVNEDVPDVHVFASSLTLKRIGGATIDFREGRFKLDLPEDAAVPGCGSSGASCGCTPESCDCSHTHDQNVK